jgi:hypothetical protein
MDLDGMMTGDGNLNDLREIEYPSILVSHKT